MQTSIKLTSVYMLIKKKVVYLLKTLKASLRVTREVETTLKTVTHKPLCNIHTAIYTGRKCSLPSLLTAAQ